MTRGRLSTYGSATLSLFVVYEVYGVPMVSVAQIDFRVLRERR